jgi:PAS domain S-box-containing protein
MGLLRKKNTKSDGEQEILRQRIAELEKELSDNQKLPGNTATSQDDYEQYFHDAAGLIAIVNTDGVVIDLNRRFERESGYTRSEIIGKSIKSSGILDDKSANKTLFYLQELLAGNPIPLFDVTAIKKDNTLASYELSAVAVKNGQEIVAIQANLRSIAKPRDIDKTPTESQGHYQTLFQLSPSGILLEDSDGIILDVNPAFCNSLGYHRDELINENIRKIVHPDNAKNIDENIKNLISGKILNHSVKSMRKDGSFCFMALNEKKIKLPDGRDGILSISEDISQRIKSDEELRKSEKSYRGLFEGIFDAIYLQNKDGKFITVNKGAEKMYGYSREEFIDKTPEFLSAPMKNDLELIKEYIQKAFRGEPQTFEFWGLKKNGVIFPKEVRLNKGTYFGEDVVIAFARDITRQKQVEEQLVKKSQLQENLLETARHLTRSLEIKEVLNEIANGVMEILSTQSCTIYLLEKDLKSLRPVVAIDPNYKEQLLATSLKVDGSFTGQAVKSKKAVIFNESGPDSIGFQIPDTPEEADEKIIVAPFLVAEKVIGAMTLSRMKTNFTEDELSLAETYATYASAALKNAQLFNNLQKEVEEHKMAQEKIYDLNNQYESFIQNSLIGIWKMVFPDAISTKLPPRKIAELILEKGMVADGNTALAKMYGYDSKEEIVNIYPKQFVYDIDESLIRLEKFVVDGFKAEMLETEEKDKHGNIHHFRNSYFGMIKSDKLSAIWGIQMDITDQRKLEEQLRQSQKLEAVGTLAGGIAHDFNNLLTVINGHAEMSLMGLDIEHASHKDITSILNAGKRAKTLTSQLLAFSRKQIYEPKIIEINRVISSLDKMLRRLIGEDIHIDANLRHGIPLIKADPGQIEQILMNLIVNARDAINEKTEVAADKKIIIETNHTDLDASFVAEHTGSSMGSHVVLTVSDTGIGMAKETRDKIFEPFFTTKEKGLGTGLGMSTVYGIVKQNKGSIYAFSEPGLGTTIKIYWPASEEKRASDETQILTRAALLGKEFILVVEDDDGVRTFVVTALKDLGYTVYEASNGKKALDLLKDKKLKIDLMITDLIMPEMNGKELAIEVEKLIPGTKVLFSSGYTEDHIVKSGSLERGINFLPKPYTLQALAKKVREVIELS